MSKAEILPVDRSTENHSSIVPAQNGAITPMDMLNQAVASGADIDVLEKLMGLQERWEKNQARKEFDAAVSAAKAEIKPVVKNRIGHNNKRYADFAAIAAIVDPVLSKHGLSYRFRTHQDERIHITCVLFHRAGHAEENTLAGPPDQTGNKNPIQAIGSSQSYLMRYSLCGALGVATAEDDDGAATGDDEVIGEAQADELRKLLTETKSDLNRFLKWAAVPSVSDIPKAKFNDCIAMLKAKQKKAVS